MKKFFYLALAVMTALCTVACGDDDDDNGGSSKKSSLQTPKYQTEACNLTLSEPANVGNGYTLTGISLTESGRVYTKLVKNGTMEMAYGTYSYSNGTYKMKGNVSGTLELSDTRAATKSMAVTITINTPSGEKLTYDSNAEGALTVMLSDLSQGGDRDIISTWKVRGLIIDLSGDVDVYKTYRNGDLRPIREEAIAQGAEFTAEESKGFDHTVTYVTVTDEMMTIEYDDGTCDAGSWTWADREYTKFMLKLFDRHMGNKFVIDNATGSVEFQKENSYMNVTLDANISGKKTFNAKLTMMLEQVPEIK